MGNSKVTEAGSEVGTILTLAAAAFCKQMIRTCHHAAAPFCTKSGFLSLSREAVIGGIRGRASNHFLYMGRGRFSVHVEFNAAIVSRLDKIKLRYNEIGEELSSGDLNPNDLSKLSKEFSNLGYITDLISNREDTLNTLNDLQNLEKEQREIGDEDATELADMSLTELEEVVEEKARIESEIIRYLTPRDEADDRNIVIEVRAGTGGDEASLFASELFRMYQKYAQIQGWKWEELSLAKTEIGGFKEAQATIIGENVFKYMKFESGTHRVQRVPVNDTKMQTSGTSVVVLPEAQEVDVNLLPSELQIDVFRSSGAGGQSVNKTESAVRITHLPTGLSVSMQDERSQHQNKAKAMQYLRAKVYDLERRKANEARQKLRNASAGTGDRSDKIRTYNFPQDRVTDHRVGVTIQGVDRVLGGVELEGIVEQLVNRDNNQRLEDFLEELQGAD